MSMLLKNTLASTALALALVGAPPAFAQPLAPADPAAIPLRAAPPASNSIELWEPAGGGRKVRNVTAPSLTPVLPAPGTATGAAVIVAPGGAFYELEIDDEGYKVAHWLADHGVAAFVLKYRTDPTPADDKAYQKVLMHRLTGAARGEPVTTPPAAVEDAEAAVRLVRARAAAWGLDPHRVGFLGFSAGAMTTLGVGLDPDSAARPDFIAPIYGPMSARPVPADAPPMFVAIALDDPLFGQGKDVGLIDAWRAAGRPVEAHLYARGGHGFAQGKSAATRLWIDEFYAWMQDRALLRPTP